MTGPLAGTRVVELAGLGPAPFAAMVLADLGAEVVRIDRLGVPPIDPDRAGLDVLNRNRPTVHLDLKSEEGRQIVHELAAAADVMIEGFRPGVVERLGIGPDHMMSVNPRLVYGHMTGWGQNGPYASTAGHDLTYAAAAGAIAHIGRRGQPPTPPLNLVADFGGGAMLLVTGILAALVERATSGRGQVVDAAMIDGVSMLMAPMFGAFASGAFTNERGSNLLDSGAPFYDCYECADGEFVAVAAIEPQFFAELVDGLGLDAGWCDKQYDKTLWPELREEIARVLVGETMATWVERFSATDACVGGVLRLLESGDHPQLAARGTVVEVAGAQQPRPAPRFSRTDASAAIAPAASLGGEEAEALLVARGVAPGTAKAARTASVLR